MSTRTQKIQNNYWEKLKLEEGWLSFLALLLAFMTVVWSIEGANWVEGSNLLPRAALVSFFIGFGLARVRFVPALLAHSFIVSVGLVFVGLLVSPYGDVQYSDWTRRLGSTVLTVVRWCEDAILGRAHDNNLVYLASLTFGVWLLGYASAWLLFRSHKSWWTLALLGTVLMTNLSFNPPNAVYSFSIFLILALLLLVRFNAFQDEQRWRSLRLYFQPGIWRMAMGVGGVLALVVMAVAFATPSSSQIETFGQVLDKASQPFNGIKGVWDIVGTGGNNPNGSFEGRSNTNYNSLNDSFTIGGPLRLSNEPVLRVSAENNTAPSYLQTQTMDQYDGKGWINTYQLAVNKSPEDVLFRKLSLAANQALPTPTDQGKRTSKITLTPLVPDFNLVLSLGDLVSLDRQSLVAFHYIKTSFNAPLNAFQLKEIPDGNGGKRTILVDQTTGKTVPPAALDLIKYLKQGSQMNELAIPPTFAFTYINSGNNYQVGEYRLGLDGKPIRVPLLSQGFSLNGTTGGWSYQVPSIDEVKALNLQPGGAKVINKLTRATVKNAAGETIEVESSVYLNQSGDYLVTLESPYARGESARNRFEATEVGAKVQAEIKKLEDSVKGNKVSYTLVNGKPANLQYEGYEPNYDDLTGATLAQPVAPGESYATQARRYGADIQSLRQTLAGEYPDWVKERYLQLPANFSQGIKAQALELTAGLTNPYDKVMAIQNYLRSLNYTTDPPPTPEGRDEIDFFLFDSKSGYCVHFSSAMVLMLRSLDIPAREVTGFIGGEFDAAANNWLVRGSAAHAWPQVYFKNTGWVDFEPTPNQDNIERPADPSAVPPAPISTPPAAPVTIPASDGTAEGPDPLIKPELNPAGETPAATATPEQKPFPVWLAVILGLILAGAGLYFSRKLYLKRQYALPDLSPLAIYNRMSHSARKAGLRGRSGMTPYEYANYLGRNIPGAAESVHMITRAYVRRRYGPESPELEDIKHQQHVEALKSAEQKLYSIEATGHDAKQEDLWQLFKAHTDVYNDDHSARVVWENYQAAVLAYRQQKRLDKVTPDFVRLLQQRFKHLSPKQG
jgi:transglutaminase-like putative cysteine protease